MHLSVTSSGISMCISLLHHSRYIKNLPTSLRVVSLTCIRPMLCYHIIIICHVYTISHICTVQPLHIDQLLLNCPLQDKKNMNLPAVILNSRISFCMLLLVLCTFILKTLGLKCHKYCSRKCCQALYVEKNC